jgi:hypothetical protein
MLERHPPGGGLGPPPGRGHTYPFHPYRGNKAGFLPPPQQAAPPPLSSQPITLPRSPRLTVTPSSPDNVGPALGRLGKSIGLSVEMLATVGETIGDENPDIRGDMLDACRESRAVSTGLEKLCESLSHTVIGGCQINNSTAGVPSGNAGNLSFFYNILLRDSLETLQRLFRDSSETLQRFFRDSSETLQRLFRDSSETLVSHL